MRQVVVVATRDIRLGHHLCLPATRFQQLEAEDAEDDDDDAEEEEQD